MENLNKKMEENNGIFNVLARKYNDLHWREVNNDKLSYEEACTIIKNLRFEDGHEYEYRLLQISNQTKEEKYLRCYNENAVDGWEDIYSN